MRPHMKLALLFLLVLSVMVLTSNGTTETDEFEDYLFI